MKFTSREEYRKFVDGALDRIMASIEAEKERGLLLSDSTKIVAMYPEHLSRAETEPTPEAPSPVPVAESGDGNVCPSCGSSRLMRAGTCYTCLNCASTTGCS